MADENDSMLFSALVRELSPRELDSVPGTDAACLISYPIKGTIDVVALA